MAAGGRAVLRWVPAGLYAANIWALSSRAGQGPLPVNAYLLHFFGYGAFGALVWAALAVPGRPALRVAIAAAAIAGAYGVIDEIHQSYVPGRVADPLDAAADLAGAAVAAGGMSAVLRPRVGKPAGHGKGKD
ncbi:MAG: VanZ family protein [Planctomycetes bacterium]|nr:VanZ family protein [Planctomycetota bacterium]